LSSPRISILLPARNAAATLDPCLRSITRQTERSWECIVVDDGSTDGTAAIARSAAAADGRFHVISTPPHGLISALTEGLTHCRGAFVARMDADDVMHRDRLAAQADALDGHPSMSGVGCQVRLFPRASMTARLVEYERWLNQLQSPEDVARDVFVECPIAHPTLMMRREDMTRLGYADRGWPEDYDLMLRAYGAGMRIGAVPRRLLAWRNGPDSLSRSDPRYALERFTACRAHYIALHFLGVEQSYVLWGYGGTGRALYRALSALDRHPTHIVEVKRERIGQRIHGAEVVPHDRLPELRGRKIVVSVARAGPRGEIRAVMARFGFVEGADFICAA
jgi:glycosyltransferase involved in cell wall biosynthesis